jgi:hypothetical protein
MSDPALAARLEAHVRRLAATPRAPGSTAHRDAADYIRGHLEPIRITLRPDTL